MDLEKKETTSYYEISKEPFATGGFAEVYRGTHLETSEKVAIKKITRKFKDLDAREVDVMRKLKHPHIILFKEAYLDKDERLNIVTSFAENGSLDVYMKQEAYTSLS